MTGVASVCALAAKHHHQRRVRQPELAVLKSAKAKAGNCNRKESLVRHHRRRQVDLARAEVTRLYHPKRQSSRIGSEGKTTIPWKRPPKVRRRKQLDVRPRALWRWARVWLVPLRVVWQAVLLHRVPGVYILSPVYRPTNVFNRLYLFLSPPPRTIIRSASFTCVNNVQSRSSMDSGDSGHLKYNNNSRRTSHHKQVPLHSSGLLYRYALCM